MNQDISFGASVRQRRREMDLTQEELARRVGCATITLRKIEADDLRPSVQIAERLAMALAIPLDERAAFIRWARSVQPVSSELPKVTPPPSMEEIGQEDLTGRAIRGYALADRIGKGGMGTVYRAVQPNVEREVAVKIILPAFANHPDFIRRFEAEAQLVARLEHPHIVPLYDYWREPGVAYLVMRLLRGGSIQDLLEQGPIGIDIVSKTLEQICSALTSAHRIGIIHRDLKPANVLLDEDGNSYLVDFGIAKNLGNPDNENQTQVDAMIGSPQYMSPEQIQSLSVSPQTDIYCLGVMVYEMLTGAVPFTGPTPFEFIQQHMTAPMPPLSARREGLPFELDDVIKRATAKESSKRYPDAQSLFTDFNRALGRLTDARPLSISYEEDEFEFEGANPFKGLHAFHEADAENFFGRETLVQQLLARLGEGGELKRFLAVIGPSGSGKSSVVRAGLIPALRRGGLPGSENWFIVDLLPGKHPFEEIEAALLRVAVNPPESLLSQLKDGNRGLLRAVHRILPHDDSVELVLVIDQFEEFFTLVEDEAERNLLLDNIANAIMDERSRLRVVITMRADFIDRPLRYVDFGEMMNRRFEFVLPLSADEIERAIAGPAQRVGLKLEKGLVSTIIHHTGNQPGTLPLLQYALSELFDKREGRTLTNKAYREIGGVLGALGSSAEALFISLDQTEQSIARQLFLRLVTLGEGVEDTRRRVLREELESLGTDTNQLTKVLEAFGRARLLSFDHDPITRGATIEVAHEALLREWLQLRDWLSESRADVRIQRQLNNATQEWIQVQKDEGFLLTGSRLEQFEGWASNTTIALTKDESDFLSACIAERDRSEAEELARQRRELEAAQKLAETEKQAASQLKTRNRVITSVAVVALVLAVVASLFSRQSNENAQIAVNAQATAQANADVAELAKVDAQNAQFAAEYEKQLAVSRELAIASIENLEVDPERSVLLALEALKSSDTQEAENALHRAVQASRVVFTLHHQGPVEDILYSADWTRLITASDDGTVKIWNANTGEELLTLNTGPTNSISLDPADDGALLAAAFYDTKDASVWNTETGQQVLTLSGHTAGINEIQYSPDGTRIATAGNDNTARIWDAASGMELLTLSDFADIVINIAFSPDGTRLATSSDDGTVKIWDTATGQRVLTLSDFDDSILDLKFSQDGTMLTTSGADSNKIQLWNAITGQIIRTLVSGEGLYIDSNDEENLIATPGERGTASVWDATTGEKLLTLYGHASSVNRLAFNHDGTRLATASNDGTARVWDITPEGSHEWLTIAKQTDWIWDANYNPDGTKIVTASFDGTAKVFDAKTGTELLALLGHDGGAYSAVFSPDGSRIATSGKDNTAKIWDAATGVQLLTLSGHGGGNIGSFLTGVVSVDYSPDGTQLASAGADGNVILWDANNGKQLKQISNNGIGITKVEFTPDGTHLLFTTDQPPAVSASGEDATVQLWDLANDKQIFVASQPIRIWGLDINHDATRIVTGGFGGIVRIRDIGMGQVLFELSGLTTTTGGVAFSPDDSTIATSNGDGIKLWDANNGKQILSLTDEAGFAFAFSPDGTRLLTTRADGSVHIFFLKIDDLIEMATSRLARSLTTEECQQYLHLDACPTEP